MKLRDVRGLVASTGDPAFAVDGEGRIVAWNDGAVTLFGLSEEDALGRICGVVLQGHDTCGPVCSPDCSIFQAARMRRPMGNFDLQVATVKGREWCNVSVMIAGESTGEDYYAVHVLRSIDLRKKLEMAVHDVIRKELTTADERTISPPTSPRAPIRNAPLTDREIEILRLLSGGNTTAFIADALNISRTTVNNHIQHILHKLDAHTRLEAVRRAEAAGLV